MAELINHSLPSDFPNRDVQEGVVLIEAVGNLLTGFLESLTDYTKARIEKMGIAVRLNAQVVEIGQDFVRPPRLLQMNRKNLPNLPNVNGKKQDE